MKFEGNAYFHIPGYGPGHDFFVSNKGYENGEYDLPGGYKLILSCMGSFWRSTEVLFGDARSIWSSLVSLGPSSYSYSVNPLTQGNWWRARKINTQLIYQDYPQGLFTVNLGEFDLSSRTIRTCHNGGIEELGELVSQTEQQFRHIKSVGDKTHDEIKKFLAARGLRFGITEKQIQRYHNQFVSGCIKDPPKIKYPKRFKGGLVDLCGADSSVVVAAESGSFEVGELLDNKIAQAQLLRTKWFELATSK